MDRLIDLYNVETDDSDDFKPKGKGGKPAAGKGGKPDKGKPGQKGRGAFDSDDNESNKVCDLAMSSLMHLIGFGYCPIHIAFRNSPRNAGLR